MPDLRCQTSVSSPVGFRAVVRKFLALSMVVGSVCTAGCNSGDGESAGGDSSNDKRPVIAFVTNQKAEFWTIAGAGCQDAAKDLDIVAEIREPSDAAVNIQKQIVEDLLTSGIDALAISPIDAENQVDMLNEWAKQVPLICHDSDSPKSDRKVFIAVDNYQAGRTLGAMVRDAMPDGGKIVICVGRLQQDNARKRRQGVIDELLGRSSDPQRFDDPDGVIKGNGYSILATFTDGGDQTVALQKAEDALTKYPEMNCFVGLFVYNPPACLNAAKKAGRDDIIIGAFDEAEATLEAIRNGEMIGTMSQNPYMYGYKSMEVLKALLDGDDSVIPESGYIPVEAVKVTKENVDEFQAKMNAQLGK